MGSLMPFGPESKNSRLLEPWLSAAPVGLALLDRQLRYVHVNTAMAAINGLPAEAHLGRSMREILPELATRVEGLCESVLEKGAPLFNVELTGMARGSPGEERHWLASYYPVSGEGGEIEAVGAVVQDITERKRSEIAGKNIEERLRLAAEIAKIRGWEWNVPAKEVYFNAPGGDIAQFEKSNIEEIEEKFLATLHPDVRENIGKKFERAIREKTDFAVTYKRVLESGESRWITVKAKIFYDESSQPYRVVGVARDVTEEKQREDAIAWSERRYRSLALATSQVVWTATPEGELKNGLDHFMKLTGVDPEELQQHGWLAAVHPDDRQSIREKLAIAKRDKTVLEVEERLHLADGCYRYFLSRAVPVFGDDGEIHEWIGTCSDVTDRREAEVARALLLEREQKGRQELQAAVDALERSNDNLLRFAQVVSHDLQEPLRAVMGYTQLLQERYRGKLDASADEFMGFTVEGARRMQALIRDLLAYAQLSSVPRKLVQVDCKAILNWTLMNLSAAISDSQAVVTHDPLPSITGDQMQLIQLFQNLIGNAIKYRRPAEPLRIHIGCKPQDESWLFCVQDNGIGIEGRFFDKIFGVFRRLHGAEYPGTGIGLAICQKIVEQHEGRIWVESEPGQGSTFYFTLPA